VRWPNQARLRVSSPLLCAILPAFVGLFAANPADDNDNNNDGHPQREVNLPGDNAEAMYILLCLLHHRTGEVSWSLAPRQVLDVAVVADKCGVVPALRFFLAWWLRPLSRQQIQAWSLFSSDSECISSSRHAACFPDKYVLYLKMHS
jgi:hypothetical protein